VVDDYRELAGMLPLVAEIAPETCRAEAERRFAPRVMVDRYLAAFTSAIVGRGREAQDETVDSGLLPVLASEAF
jgi:hypothetical protein